MSKQGKTKAGDLDFQRLEENLGYTFQNPKLLKTALTHSSFANEAHNGTRSNERLEFLGDAVLSIVVSHLGFAISNQNRLLIKQRKHYMKKMKLRLTDNGTIRKIITTLLIW